MDAKASESLDQQVQDSNFDSTHRALDQDFPPSELPTASPSKQPISGPTPRPTPSVPFSYEAEGDSSFGFQYQNHFSLAHQNGIRRPGWSWAEPLSGYAPFCYGEVCYNVTTACMQLGGTVLHDYVCSFPEDVKIAGPSCWEGECRSQGTGVCAEVGGTLVGVGDDENGPQWCLFRGERTVFGPGCYSGTCYIENVRNMCGDLGGSIWNRDFCILPGYRTVVGPVCWKSGCFTGDTQNRCAELQGYFISPGWCILDDCDRTVIGPTCTEATQDLRIQCHEDDTVELCRNLNGVEFAKRFCVLPGTVWSLVGPVDYGDAILFGPTNDFCRDLRGDLEGPFNRIESYNIGGSFCLIRNRFPTAGPFCTDLGCNITAQAEFCNRFGGENVAQLMCTLLATYRQAVGPLSYNDMDFEGNPEFCEGRFCAVPHPPGTVANLRCPTATPVFRPSNEEPVGEVAPPTLVDEPGTTSAGDWRGFAMLWLWLTFIAVWCLQ